MLVCQGGVVITFIEESTLYSLTHALLITSDKVNLMKKLGVSEHTIMDWREFMRDVAVIYFLNNREQIGGSGVVVEIDESLFCRHKNNMARAREDMWVLGGYEHARKKGFLVRVDRRDAATLLPIIQQWVAPG